MKPTVLFTDTDRFPATEEDLAEVAAAGAEARSLPGHDASELAAAASDAAAVLVYHATLDRAILAEMPSCRVIARCGAGYDNVDVSAARERGIVVTYVPDYGVADVADHTLALLLGCVRRLVAADAAVRSGGWPTYAELGPMHRLAGRRLGLLGFGRIARAVAVRARAFGMSILVHDPYVAAAEVVAEGALPVDADTLFAESDVVSLHAPLTPSTRGAVDRRALGRMRPNAILINTGRGELVDEDALVDALREHRLAAAGLDVYTEEPLPADSPLRSLRSVTLTPHIAAFTDEALSEVRRRALADALRVLAGAAPRDPVPA